MQIRLTQDIIIAAIEGLEGRKRHIDEQLAALREGLARVDRPQLEVLDNSGDSTTANEMHPAIEMPKKKRKMSAAGRRSISLAQKARWAATKRVAS